jgi:hypothetical protein
LYRVFIDEVGNHDMKSDDPNHRHLGLTGVIMSLEYETGTFTNSLNAIKQEFFETQGIVLHRREMLEAKPPFEALNDVEIRKRFDAGLLRVLRDAEYRVFTVVIDKKEHKERYAVWQFHPYHYCLTVLLERYVRFLDRIGHVGDVLVESRGRKENRQLERAFRHVYDHGSDHVPVCVFRNRLTSMQLKVKPKASNIAGLQLADLIANPSCRSLICEKNGVQMNAAFGAEIEAILKTKYLSRPRDGLITGWGTKWLP